MKVKFPILLEGYLRDAKQYLATIDTHLSDGDIDQVIGAAHSFKSSSGLLGIVGVSEIANKIEYDAKAMKDAGGNDLEKLRPDFDALQNSFSSAEDDLRIELSKAKNQAI